MDLVRRRWTFAFACLALLAALLVPQASQAQVLYGSLVGNVKDTSGATMPGATVTITNNDTKLTRETVTNSTGGYDFATVSDRQLHGQAHPTGLQEHHPQQRRRDAQRGHARRPGRERRRALRERGGDGRDDAAQDRSRRGERRADRQAAAGAAGDAGPQLPEPVPHAARLHPAGERALDPVEPSRSLVFNVNGSSRSSNNTRIDGASTTNIWLPHVTAYVPALESIETVNVVTNSFDAEQGLAGGAAINVQIRSGTNAFHGRPSSSTTTST
jgi:hypothetical protein